MSQKFKALIALGATVIFFSVLVIVSKAIVADVSPMYILFLRMLVAEIAFLPFFIKSRVWRKLEFKKLLAVSALSTINVVFFIWGIQYTSASASQLIYAAQPILTIVISVIFWKERFPLRTILGVTIGLLGIFFIIYRSSIEKGETITGGVVGNLAMVVAMTGWLFYILFSKRLSKYFSPVEIGSTSILVSLAVATILCFVELYTGHLSIVLNRNVILAGLYMGFFGSFLTYLFMQYAIKYLSPLTVNLTSYIQPVTVAILAIILLGEKLTFYFTLGSMLVFLGVFLTATLEFYHRRRA